MSEETPKGCPFAGKTIDVEPLTGDYEIAAYPSAYAKDLPIHKASTHREWMSDTPNKFANRCLPLLAANGMGWVVRVPKGFFIEWDGTDAVDAINVYFFDGSDPHHQENQWVTSHFGSGVLTFHVGYLFKTSNGNGLWVKGPSNQFKLGIQPCEGFVETDWLPFTFTMNWKVLVPNKKIFFEKGDVFCQIIPYPKEYIEKFNPILKEWNADGKVETEYEDWANSRTQHNERLNDQSIEWKQGDTWEKNYFKGEFKDGTKCTEDGFTHHTKWKVKDFRKG